jgi:hypothetical protein
MDSRSKGKWPWTGRRCLVLLTGKEITVPAGTVCYGTKVSYSTSGLGPITKEQVRPYDPSFMGNMPPHVENDAWVDLDLASGSGYYVVRVLGVGEA